MDTWSSTWMSAELRIIAISILPYILISQLLILIMMTCTMTQNMTFLP